MATSLKTAIREVKEHLQLNGDPDSNDAVETLMDDCGQDTEYCDWECPFS